MDDQETREELNRLYWESDGSVSDIADELDISRRALYDRIEPLPAGVPCSECGADLGFRNRTTAENREAECSRCGHEVTLDAGAAEPGRNAAEPQVEQERAAAPLSPTRSVPGSGGSTSGPILAVMLLGGIGMGAISAYLFRRG